MIDIILVILTIVAGYFVHQHWASWPLTIAVAFAVMMILRNIKPAIERPWQRKHPPVKVDILKYDNPETLGQGVHFLIMTQEIFFNCKTQADTDYLLELSKECIEKLLQENELFKYRYNYAVAMKMPVQFAYCGCGATDMSVSMHYLKWLQSFGVSKLEGYRQDVDIFTIDDTIKHPSGDTVHRIMFQAVLDPKLPLPKEK